jgi:hypothetical protein
MAANKVILYFESQADALHFALTAGSVMVGDDADAHALDLLRKMQRAQRICMDHGVETESGSQAAD